MMLSAVVNVELNRGLVTETVTEKEGEGETPNEWPQNIHGASNLLCVSFLNMCLKLNRTE
jgi:hypothetical protein